MLSSSKLALALLVLVVALGVWGIARPEQRRLTPAIALHDPITGCVRDRYGPVAGARVRIKGTTVTSQTDANGRFRLPAPLVTTGHVTAWKEGHLIAGTPLGAALLDLRLLPLPSTDHASYQWVDPAPDPTRRGNCANCHAEIYREWSRSGHSRSASGRHFRNLYEGTNWDGAANVGWGLLTQYPDGSGVCAACHAPAIPDDDSAAELDLRKLSGIAARGVHCDYCHKIAAVGDGELGRAHGRFNLRLLRPGERRGLSPPDRRDEPGGSPQQLFFGPLDDVDRGEDAYAPLYHESRYCASCHEGIVFGVHVYSTYSEWLASPARRQGKQCQDCHMTPSGTLTNIAPGRGGLERDPRTLANHRFFAPDRDDMLRRCLHVETATQKTTDGMRVTVRVRAENVGHRVPTGFIDRHLILTVEALDADKKSMVVRTGPKLPDAVGPDLSGQPGRLFAKLLTGPDGKAPAPFWRSGGIWDDTRLTPDRAEEFVWHFSPETTQMRIRVVYRRFWAEVVRSKGWPDQDAVVHDLIVLPH